MRARGGSPRRAGQSQSQRRACAASPHRAASPRLGLVCPDRRGKLTVLLLFGLKEAVTFVQNRGERPWSLLCGCGTTSPRSSPQAPEEPGPADELMASLWASSLAPCPGRLCFDIFLLFSPCFLFSWIFPFCGSFPVSVWSPRCGSHWLFW